MVQCWQQQVQVQALKQRLSRRAQAQLVERATSQVAEQRPMPPVRGRFDCSYSLVASRAWLRWMYLPVGRFACPTPTAFRRFGYPSWIYAVVGRPGEMNPPLVRTRRRWRRGWQLHSRYRYRGVPCSSCRLCFSSFLRGGRLRQHWIRCVWYLHDRRRSGCDSGAGCCLWARRWYYGHGRVAWIGRVRRVHSCDCGSLATPA